LRACAGASLTRTPDPFEAAVVKGQATEFLAMDGGFLAVLVLLALRGWRRLERLVTQRSGMIAE